MQDKMPAKCQKECQNICQIECQNICQKIHPDGMSGTMSELCVGVGLTRRKLFFGDRCSKIKRKRNIKKRLPLKQECLSSLDSRITSGKNASLILNLDNKHTRVN